MNAAFLCLGGNMGDRLAYLARAKELISKRCGKITAESRVYETQAWGVDRAPDYYNQCIKIETGVGPDDLLNNLLTIEKELGRVRTGDKNESRFIDIDILFYNNDIIHKEHFHVPHPRLHLRQFVLKPLAEIAAELRHPVLRNTVSQLLKDCSDPNSAKPI